MMKLYQITELATGKHVPGAFFATKPAAKTKRKQLNGDESDPRNLKFVVSPGPDHRNFKKEK